VPLDPKTPPDIHAPADAGLQQNSAVNDGAAVCRVDEGHRSGRKPGAPGPEQLVNLAMMDALMAIFGLKRIEAQRG